MSSLHTADGELCENVSRFSTQSYLVLLGSFKSDCYGVFIRTKSQWVGLPEPADDAVSRCVSMEDI